MRNPFVKDSNVSNRYFVKSNLDSKMGIHNESVDSTVKDSGPKASLDIRKISGYNVKSWSYRFHSFMISLFPSWILFIKIFVDFMMLSIGIIGFHDIIFDDLDEREFNILGDSMDVFTVDSDLHDYVTSQKEFLRLRSSYYSIAMEIKEIAKNAIADTNEVICREFSTND